MQQLPNIDWNQATSMKCEKCESEYFEEAYIIKKVSKLLTGQSQDTVAPIPIFRCADCGHVNKEFKPQILSK